MFAWHKIYKTDNYINIRTLDTQNPIDKEKDFAEYTTTPNQNSTSWVKNKNWEVLQKNSKRELYLRIIQFDDNDILHTKVTQKGVYPMKGTTATDQEIETQRASIIFESYIPIDRIFYCENGPGENHRTRIYLGNSKERDLWVAHYTKVNHNDPGPTLYKNKASNFWCQIVSIGNIKKQSTCEDKYPDILQFNKCYDDIKSAIDNTADDLVQMNVITDTVRTWISRGFNLQSGLVSLEAQAVEWKKKLNSNLNSIRTLLISLNNSDLKVISNENEYTYAIESLVLEDTEYCSQIDNMLQLLRCVLQNLADDLKAVVNAKNTVSSIKNIGIDIGNAEDTMTNQYNQLQNTIASSLKKLVDLRLNIVTDAKTIV